LPPPWRQRFPRLSCQRLWAPAWKNLAEDCVHIRLILVPCCGSSSQH